MKKDKKKNIHNFLIIVFGIAALAAASVFIFPLYTVGGEGFTVNSIVSDRTISNDADIQSANFIVNTVIDGSGGKVVGFISEDEFQTPTASVQYPLEITAESVNERANYLIRNQKIPIEKFQLVKKAPLFSCPGDTVHSCRPLGSIYTHCYVQTSSGLKGSLYSKNINFDVKVSAKSHNEYATATLSNYQNTAVNLRTGGGQYIGTAKWLGTLLTGVGLPSEGNFAVILPSGSNAWKVIDVGDWNSYQSQLTQFKSNMYSCSASEDDVNRLNSKADWLLSLQNTKILGSYQEQTTDEQNREVITVSLGDNNLRWGNPNVVWTIRAYWLGAYIPVATPSIIGIEHVEIYSGEYSLLKVTVKNIGDVESSFDAAIMQPCNVKQEAGARLTIPAGGTGTFEIRTSQGVQNLVEDGSCQVKVYNVNNPDKYDTASFSYTLKKARECDPGKYKGEYDCISHCSAEGLWETVKCCTDKEQLSFDSAQTQYDGWYCKAKGDIPPPPVPGDCIKACRKHYGCSVLSPLDSCNLRCEIECWIKAHMLWVAGGIGLLFLYFIFKARRAHPAYQAYQMMNRR